MVSSLRCSNCVEKVTNSIFGDGEVAWRIIGFQRAKVTYELADKRALRESEVYKIKCAMKHFDALRVDADANYSAPVKEYSVFKTRAKGVMHA